MSSLSKTSSIPASPSRYLRKLLLQHMPESLQIAALLDKPSRRLEKIDADYVGFSIPNDFVIGYGMDYAERYRNLPDISPYAA